MKVLKAGGPALVRCEDGWSSGPKMTVLYVAQDRPRVRVVCCKIVALQNGKNFPKTSPPVDE